MALYCMFMAPLLTYWQHVTTCLIWQSWTVGSVTVSITPERAKVFWADPESMLLYNHMLIRCYSMTILWRFNLRFNLRFFDVVRWCPCHPGALGQSEQVGVLRQKSSSPLGRIGQVATPDMNSRLLSLQAGTDCHNFSNCFPFAFSKARTFAFASDICLREHLDIKSWSQLGGICVLQFCGCCVGLMLAGDGWCTIWTSSRVSHPQTPRPKVCLACSSTKSVESWFHWVAAAVDQSYKLQSDIESMWRMDLHGDSMWFCWILSHCS